MAPTAEKAPASTIAVSLPPGVSEALRNWDNDAFASALGASLSSGYGWGVPQAQVVLERIVATWATAREILKCGNCRGCGNTAPDALTGDCGRWANLSEAFMAIVPMYAWMPMFTRRSPVSFGMSPNATSLIVHERHIIALLQMGALTDVYHPGTDDDSPFLPFIRMCRVGATSVVRYMAERRPSVVNEKQPQLEQPPLVAALLEGHIDTANALLDLGADPTVPMRVHGMTTTYPVAAAVCMDRECAILPRLLDLHPELLDWKNEAHVTRLRDAVCHRNIKAIAELLRRGARTDDISRAGRTLLMEPFSNQDLAVASALLEGGAAAEGRAPRDACLGSLLTAAQMAVDTPVPCGGCRACLGVPLESWAAAHKSLRIDCRDAFPVFELALKHLAPGAVHMLLPKNCGHLAERAYLPAAIVHGTPTPEREARVIRALKLLREHGFDIAGPGHGGMTTPLHMAANCSLTRVIEFLITEAGAAPDCTSGSCQMTPLSVALAERKSAAADKLLALGAVPHAPFTAMSDEHGYMQSTALHLAALVSGAGPVLKRMLAADSQAMTRLDSDGGNVFHSAAFDPMGNMDVLLACGLPGLQDAINQVREKHPRRDTPLHMCLQGGNPADAVRLIKAGARVDIPDARGLTAVDLARHHHRIVQAAVASALREPRPARAAPAAAASSAAAAGGAGGVGGAGGPDEDSEPSISALAAAGGAGKKAAKSRKQSGQKPKKGSGRKAAAKPAAGGEVVGAGVASAGHPAAAASGDEGSDDDAAAEGEDVLDGSLVD